MSATYNSGAHSGASFRLLGDGISPTAPSDDGVYLLSMTYSSSQVGLNDSDPFYFVLHKNASATDVAAAVNSLNVASSLRAVCTGAGPGRAFDCWDGVAGLQSFEQREGEGGDDETNSPRHDARRAAGGHRDHRHPGRRCCCRRFKRPARLRAQPRARTTCVKSASQFCSIAIAIKANFRNGITRAKGNRGFTPWPVIWKTSMKFDSARTTSCSSSGDT